MQGWISGLVCLWLSVGAAAAGQVSIGFEGPPEGPAPDQMPEDGYSVITRDMMISSAVKSGDGTDGANEIESTMNKRGGIEILRDAPFRFVSLDWQAENGAPTVTVTGYYGDTPLGTEDFHLPAGAAAGAFVTFEAKALSGQVLDRLLLYPQRDSGGMGALDRVILEDAAELPETS